MRGGSVRLTQAVRLAACGKEPEEKLWAKTTNGRQEWSFHPNTEKLKERGREQRQQKTDRKDKEKDNHMMSKETNSTSSHLCWKKMKWRERKKGKRERQMSTDKTEWAIKNNNNWTNHGSEDSKQTNFIWASKEETRVERNRKEEKREEWQKTRIYTKQKQQNNKLVVSSVIRSSVFCKGGANRKESRQSRKRGGKRKLEKRGEGREHYKHREDNSDTHSKYLIKKLDYFLCPCYTGFMKDVSLAKQIQLTQKKMVNLSMIMFISLHSWKPTFCSRRISSESIFDFLVRCTAASSCHFLLLWGRKQSSPNHSYNRLIQVNPCSVTYCNACSICCRRMMSQQ